MSRPAEAGPDDAGDVEAAELSPTALVRSSRPTISETKDWRAGASKADADRRTRRPARRRATPGRAPVTAIRPSSSDETAIADLGDLEQPALGEPVGDHAGVRREQQHRQELQPGGDAERGAAGARKAQHQPVLGDALHPGADVGHHAADERTAGSWGCAGSRKVGLSGRLVSESRLEDGGSGAQDVALLGGRGRAAGGPATRRGACGRRGAVALPCSVSVTTTTRPSLSCGRRVT